jgi:hypothetical protein
MPLLNELAQQHGWEIPNGHLLWVALNFIVAEPPWWPRLGKPGHDHVNSPGWNSPLCLQN